MYAVEQEKFPFLYCLSMSLFQVAEYLTISSSVSERGNSVELGLPSVVHYTLKSELIIPYIHEKPEAIG